MTGLSRHDREAIFKRVCRLVETKHFNPKLNGQLGVSGLR